MGTLKEPARDERERKLAQCAYLARYVAIVANCYFYIAAIQKRTAIVEEELERMGWRTVDAST